MTTRLCSKSESWSNLSFYLSPSSSLPSFLNIFEMTRRHSTIICIFGRQIQWEKLKLQKLKVFRSARDNKEMKILIFWTYSLLLEKQWRIFVRFCYGHMVLHLPSEFRPFQSISIVALVNYTYAVAWTGRKRVALLPSRPFRELSRPRLADVRSCCAWYHRLFLVQDGNIAWYRWKNDYNPR